MHKNRQDAWARFYSIFRTTDMRLRALILPVCLALVTGVFEGIGLGLLVPLSRGVINMDFSFAREIWLLGSLIERFSEWSGRPLAAAFGVLVLSVIAAIITKNIFFYLSRVYVNHLFFELLHRMRKLIFERYLSFSKIFYDQSNIGYLTDVLQGYIQQIALSSRQLFQPIVYFFTLIAYLGLMFFISPEVTLFCLLFFPGLYFILNKIVLLIKKSSSAEVKAQKLMSYKIGNILTCIPLVKAYGRESQELSEFSDLSRDLTKHQYSLSKKQDIVGPVQEVFTILAFLFLLLVMAMIVADGGEAKIGGFLVFFILLRKALNCVAGLNNSRAILARLSGALTEVSNLLDGTGEYLEKDGTQKFEGLKSAINFRAVNFSYRNQVPVLKNVSFSIPKGKVVAVVGQTGAGKSTLAQLLMRFYDCPPGMIYFDEQDIHDLTLASLRSHIALISQETMLFNESLRFNLLYGLDRAVTEEEIKGALTQSRLADFIEALPEGMGTVIGDRGVQLSGGEKQRLAIARAILKGAEIFIFDEATSSLDSKTEELVQEAMKNAIKDKTALIIAHRLSTIQNADRIVVLENGSVVEEGSFNDLLTKEGKFYSYWKMQSPS